MEEMKKAFNIEVPTFTNNSDIKHTEKMKAVIRPHPGAGSRCHFRNLIGGGNKGLTILVAEVSTEEGMDQDKTALGSTCFTVGRLQRIDMRPRQQSHKEHRRCRMKRTSLRRRKYTSNNSLGSAHNPLGSDHDAAGSGDSTAGGQCRKKPPRRLSKQ